MSHGANIRISIRPILFNNLIKVLDEVVDNMLMKLANGTELGGTLNTTEDRKIIQGIWKD